jgi:intein/homing endonuclease
MNWQEIKEQATNKASLLGETYVKRLEYEIAEIEKQGANDYWVDLVTSSKKFDHNKNGLIIAYLLNLTDIDPIKSNIEHIITYATDFPDVDTDLEPGTREKIEEFAAATYGRDKVCSVGLWQTYHPKLALQDAARAIGGDLDEIIALTKDLPEEFDSMDLQQAVIEYPQFRSFAENNVDLVKMAYRMVGGIKAQGRHAGGLIIANIPIKEHIPLALCNGYWTSMWTEGRSPQLSKFGFVKFDMLGLKTLSYIKECVKFIEKNQNIKIVWDDIDYEEDRAGWKYNSDGSKEAIRLNDPLAIQMANDLKTETVFQFETNLAKSIINKSKVKTIDDLIVYTSLGRPGPLPMIDTYVARRDGKENWKSREHKDIIEILKDTHGVTCFDSNTIIRMANGNDKLIKDLKIGEFVYSYNQENRKIELKQVEKVGKTREGKGLKITTDDNRSIIVTSDHKFITWYGIKEAKNLSIGDLIPVPTRIDWNFEGQKLNTYNLPGSQEEWGYFVGHLINHYQVSSTGISIVCGGNEEYTDALARYIKSTFNLKTHKYYNTRSWYLQVFDDSIHSGLRLIVRDLNLECNKRIPSIVFKASASVLSACIAGLIESDGCIHNSGPTYRISIKSCNRLLINDISKAFDILGVEHNFHGQSILVWNHVKFFELIGQYLKHKTKIANITSCNEKSLGWAPKLELLEKIKDSNKTLTELNIDKSVLRYKSKYVRTSTYKKVANIGDIRYQKIKSIESVDGLEYYGLQVADNHTVIANNIIIKQCFQEQLSMLWRKLAGFTVPETEKARKAVAKKDTKDFPLIKSKWLEGASKTIGQKDANEWWEKFSTFGRYAFNKCLDKDTILIDAITGESNTVEIWKMLNKLPVLNSFKDGNIVADECVAIHANGIQDVYEIEFDDGSIERVTAGHKFLCSDGLYHELFEIINRKLDVRMVELDRHNSQTKVISTSKI